MMIRMDSKRCMLHRFAKLEKRLIFMTFAFRNNDRSFGCHFIGVELAVDHAICFKAQGQVDLISGHGFKIGSPIHICEGIPRSTFARDSLVKNICRELWSTFKLHMLDPVRNTCTAGYFIPRADAIPKPR